MPLYSAQQLILLISFLKDCATSFTASVIVGKTWAVSIPKVFSVIVFFSMIYGFFYDAKPYLPL